MTEQQSESGLNEKMGECVVWLSKEEAQIGLSFDSEML